MSKPDELQTVDQVSFFDPQTNSNPYPAYELLQQQCPVYRMPETGAYMVLRYDHVREVLRDHTTFSNHPATNPARSGRDDVQAVFKERGWEHVKTLQRTDPPEHLRYRRLLDRVFTAARVQEMTPYIESVAAELIDKFIDDGECDFNSQFAMPMPGTIIAESLGLGRDEIVRFKRWADAMLNVSYGKGPLTHEEVLANAEIELECQHHLAKIFEARRLEPTSDLMSRLVHAHTADEQPLTMHELLNLMHQLITGGFETTQSAINHAMWSLIRFPELQERLRADPSQVRQFVEEALRFESPVMFLFRTTTRDADLGGTVIPQGSTVMVGFGPANRDADRFGCPHQFDMDREDLNGHMAFGNGVHYCVGAMLARQEMATSFTQLLDRLDKIELAQPLPDPVHWFSLTFKPMHDFRIKFQKRH
ncbi:MAG: cytochrome P450 [Dehalococcoidia bacterium]